MVPDRDSFFAVVFDITKYRNTTLTHLKKFTFTVNGEEVRITVHNFRDSKYQKCAIWTVPLSPLLARSSSLPAFRIGLGWKPDRDSYGQ